MSDSRLLEMFIAGATYRHIADRLGMEEAAVDIAVRQEMAKAAQRRDLLDDEAPAVRVERLESLFRAHYPAALRGDHRSADICQKILAIQQSRPGRVDGAEIAGLCSNETESLIALRDRLAREIDKCSSPRDLAALSRQLVDVLERLAAIKPPTASKVDELAKKRARRRGAASGRSKPADTGGAAGKN